eukprot:jgi/Mesvir1/24971/Mv16940-RA.1
MPALIAAFFLTHSCPFRACASSCAPPPPPPCLRPLPCIFPRGHLAILQMGHLSMPAALMPAPRVGGCAHTVKCAGCDALINVIVHPEADKLTLTYLKQYAAESSQDSASCLKQLLAGSLDLSGGAGALPHLADPRRVDASKSPLGLPPPPPPPSPPPSTGGPLSPFSGADMGHGEGFRSQPAFASLPQEPPPPQGPVRIMAPSRGTGSLPPPTASSAFAPRVRSQPSHPQAQMHLPGAGLLDHSSPVPMMPPTVLPEPSLAMLSDTWLETGQREMAQPDLLGQPPPPPPPPQPFRDAMLLPRQGSLNQGGPQAELMGRGGELLFPPPALPGPPSALGGEEAFLRGTHRSVGGGGGSGGVVRARYGPPLSEHRPGEYPGPPEPGSPPSGGTSAASPKVRRQARLAYRAKTHSPSVKAPRSARSPRSPTAYNKFISAEIPRIRHTNSSLDHREVFKLAASNWTNSRKRKVLPASGTHAHARTSSRDTERAPSPPLGEASEDLSTENCAADAAGMERDEPPAMLARGEVPEQGLEEMGAGAQLERGQEGAEPGPLGSAGQAGMLEDDGKHAHGLSGEFQGASRGAPNSNANLIGFEPYIASNHVGEATGAASLGPCTGRYPPEDGDRMASHDTDQGLGSHDPDIGQRAGASIVPAVSNGDRQEEGLVGRFTERGGKLGAGSRGGGAYGDGLVTYSEYAYGGVRHGGEAGSCRCSAGGDPPRRPAHLTPAGSADAPHTVTDKVDMREGVRTGPARYESNW